MKAPRLTVLCLAAGVVAFAGACASRQPAAASATSSAAPWQSGTPAPLVAGVRLGDSLPHVRAVLGTPDGERELVGGARELEYWKHGVVVVTTDDQGVAMLGLLHPEAPAIRGVRVGDPVAWMEQQWGPMHRRTDDQGSYVAGRWGVLVRIDTAATPERVKSITFGWTAPNRSTQLPAVNAPDLPR